MATTKKTEIWDYNADFDGQDFLNTLEFYKKTQQIEVAPNYIQIYEGILNEGLDCSERLDKKTKELEELDRKKEIDDLGKDQYESTGIADAQYRLQDAKNEKKDAEKDEEEAERNIKETKKERWSARFERHEAFTALSSISILNISEKLKAFRKLRQSNHRVKTLKLKVKQAKDKKDHVYRRQVRADREIERANQNLKAKEQEHTQFMDKYKITKDKKQKLEGHYSELKNKKARVEKGINEQIDKRVQVKTFIKYVDSLQNQGLDIDENTKDVYERVKAKPKKVIISAIPSAKDDPDRRIDTDYNDISSVLNAWKQGATTLKDGYDKCLESERKDLEQKCTTFKTDKEKIEGDRDR